MFELVWDSLTTLYTLNSVLESKTFLSAERKVRSNKTTVKEEERKFCRLNM